MSTNVYIDGFNLYNGRVKGTPYKWLDLDAMCRMLLPTHSINRIRYFTAHVIGFVHDPGAPQRQQVYLRALRTLTSIDIHDDAFFNAHAILLPQYPLAYRYAENPPRKPPQMVQVQRREEKQTDVLMAVQLPLDCIDGDGDEYVVISNDADLVPAIKTVRDRFHKTIGVINPHSRSNISGHLIAASSYHYRTINKSVIRSCQFTDELTDATGTFRKPSSW